MSNLDEAKRLYTLAQQRSYELGKSWQRVITLDECHFIIDHHPDFRNTERSQVVLTLAGTEVPE